MLVDRTHSCAVSQFPGSTICKPYIHVKVHSFRRPVGIYSVLHYWDRTKQLLRNHDEFWGPQVHCN